MLHRKLFYPNYLCFCFSFPHKGPFPLWWPWVPTSSAIRFQAWLLASGPSAKVVLTPSL